MSIKAIDVGEGFPGQLAFNDKTPNLQSAVHQHLWITVSLKGIISQFKKVIHQRLIILLLLGFILQTSKHHVFSLNSQVSPRIVQVFWLKVSWVKEWCSSTLGTCSPGVYCTCFRCFRIIYQLPR